VALRLELFYACEESLRPVRTTKVSKDRDEAGRFIYDNTHFATEREAWESLLREFQAGVKLGASAVNQQRSALDQTEKKLVEDALRYAEVLESFRKWESEQEANRG